MFAASLPTRPARLAVLPLLAALFSCSPRADLSLQPSEWNFGSVPSYLEVTRQVLLSNRGTRAVNLRFISTCDCLRVDRSELVLPANQSVPLLLAYDPRGQSGFVEAALIVVAGRGRHESRTAVRAYGKVLPSGSEPSR